MMVDSRTNGHVPLGLLVQQMELSLAEKRMLLLSWKAPIVQEAVLVVVVDAAGEERVIRSASESADQHICKEHFGSPDPSETDPKLTGGP